MGGLSSLLLLLVPVARINIQFSQNLVIGVSCSNQQPLRLQLSTQFPCDFKEDSVIHDANLTIESCGVICQVYKDSGEVEDIMNTSRYEIRVSDGIEDLSINYVLENEDMYVPKELTKDVDYGILKENPRYLTAVRKYTENTFFFPSNEMFNLSCFKDPLRNISDFNQIEERYECKFNAMLGNRLGPKLKIGYVAYPSNNYDNIEKRKSFKVEYVNVRNNKMSPYCNIGDKENKSNITVFITFNDTEQSKLEYCRPKCIGTIPRSLVCMNSQMTIEKDFVYSFWCYLSARLIVMLFSGAAFAMFEGAAIAVLRENNGDYGLQRVYASIGGIIASPLSGWLIDFASKGKPYTDFR